MDFEQLTGPEKAAILILSMPADNVTEFLAQLDDDEVERILSAVSRFDEVPPNVQDHVLEEFRDQLGSHEHKVSGGRKRALQLIEHALDEERGARILENFGKDEKRIDWTLRAFQPQFVADALADEHPQTIALILSQVPADRGGRIIEVMSEKLRPEVLLRLANLSTVTTDVISDLEEGVAELFARRVAPPTRVGGMQVAASVLNRVAKTEGITILEGVDNRDPDVAGQIRKRMLTFNDLSVIDRRGFQLLLREVSTEDLAVALKAGSDEMRDKVFENVSSRAADQIREEIDLLGPMKLSDVEQVQDQVVEVARRLEEEGHLSIDIGGSDDALV